MRHYLNGVSRCDCMGCRDADKHTEEMVDKLQNKKKEEANEDKIKKQKELDETKKANMELSLEELDEILESLRAELDDIKNKNTEDTDEDKQSKSASLEMIGVDNSRSNKSGSKLEHIGVNNREAKSNYHVLRYNINSIESREGDELMILMGSTK